jgi:hypothetical protein
MRGPVLNNIKKLWKKNKRSLNVRRKSKKLSSIKQEWNVCARSSLNVYRLNAMQRKLKCWKRSSWLREKMKRADYARDVFMKMRYCKYTIFAPIILFFHNNNNFFSLEKKKDKKKKRCKKKLSITMSAFSHDRKIAQNATSSDDKKKMQRCNKHIVSCLLSSNSLRKVLKNTRNRCIRDKKRHRKNLTMYKYINIF